MNLWIAVFSQSRVNNAPYDGERLPNQQWQWPANTWFQARVRYLRGRNRRQAAQSIGATAH